MKKLWIILGCIAVVGIALFVVGVLLGGLKDKTAKKATETIAESFDRIELKELSADIHVARSEDGVCRLEYKQSDYLHLSVKVENGTLCITRKDVRPWYLKASILPALGYGTTTLYLPAQAYERLSLETTTGDVRVDGDFSVQSFQAEVTTGDIRVSNLQAGSASLEAATGDIRADKLTAGDVSVKSSTGDIRLSGVVAERTLRIRCTTGDVSLAGCDAGVSLTVDSTTGDVTAELLSPKRFVTDVTTGDVNVPDSVAGAAECRIETTTGDINVTVKP